ncbi:MAG: GNAT family N-acetyltransferase [Ginsengibacter sp.]|jgi:GNAT superfamily N-acetyltransferase
MTNIIKADIHDLPTIKDLARKIWPFAYGEILSVDQLEYMLDKFYAIDSLTAQMNKSKHEFYLALNNDRPAGFISVGKSSSDPAVFILHKIYVLPELQGKSIGKSLLNFVIDKVKADGGKALQLNVNRHNKAFHFYEKNGFETILEEDIDIGNGYFMNDYRMELEV